jgi:thiol-disulfide isomerase/thioredoxin
MAIFLIMTAEIPEIQEDFETDNFYRLRVHENLYDHIHDHIGTVVLFLASWCDKSKKIKKLLDENCDRNVIIVDERHPDSSLSRNFPGIYLFNGKTLEKKNMKEINDIFM